MPGLKKRRRVKKDKVQRKDIKDEERILILNISYKAEIVTSPSGAKLLLKLR